MFLERRLFKVEVPPMSFLVLKEYLKLIQFDLYLTRGNFEALYNRVRTCPTAKKTVWPNSVEQICSAVDMPASGIGKRRSACNVLPRQHVFSRDLGFQRS
jgi:hypothetical protein